MYTSHFLSLSLCLHPCLTRRLVHWVLSDGGGVLSSDRTPGHEHVPVGEQQRKHCSGKQQI